MKQRRQIKNRTESKYSESDFIKLPREEQFKLIEKYWNGHVSDFDDGTFQFSYTHFGVICKRLGFKKGIIDERNHETNQIHTSNVPQDIIYIETGNRSNTVEKKLTLSKSTIDKIDTLLGKDLSNIERSKVIDVIIEEIVDQKLQAKEAGTFGVAYKPTEAKRLL